jgi:hypothetical protein
MWMSGASDVGDVGCGRPLLDDVVVIHMVSDVPEEGLHRFGHELNDPLAVDFVTARDELLES